MFEPNSFVQSHKSANAQPQASTLIETLLARIFGHNPLVRSRKADPGFDDLQMSDPGFYGQWQDNYGGARPIPLGGYRGHMQFGPPDDSGNRAIASSSIPVGHMNFGPDAAQSNLSAQNSTRQSAWPTFNSTKSDEYIKKGQDASDKIDKVEKPGVIRNPTWQEIGLALVPSLFGAGTNYIGALGQGYLNGQQQELQRQDQERLLQMQLLREQAERYFRQADHYQNQETTEYQTNNRRAEIQQARDDDKAAREERMQEIERQRKESEANEYDKISSYKDPELRASYEDMFKQDLFDYNNRFFPKGKEDYTESERIEAENYRQLIGKTYGMKYIKDLKRPPENNSASPKKNFVTRTEYDAAANQFADIDQQIRVKRAAQAAMRSMPGQLENARKLEYDIQDLAKQRKALNAQMIIYQNNQNALRAGLQQRADAIRAGQWGYAQEKDFASAYYNATGEPWEMQIPGLKQPFVRPGQQPSPTRKR